MERETPRQAEFRASMRRALPMLGILFVLLVVGTWLSPETSLLQSGWFWMWMASLPVYVVALLGTRHGGYVDRFGLLAAAATGAIAIAGALVSGDKSFYGVVVVAFSYLVITKFANSTSGRR